MLPSPKMNHFMPSTHQLTCIVNFMEKHPRFARNRLRMETERAERIKLEADFTNMMNSISPGFPSRSTKAWKKYWADYKSRLKKAVTDSNIDWQMDSKLSGSDLDLKRRLVKALGFLQNHSPISPPPTKDPGRQISQMETSFNNDTVSAASQQFDVPVGNNEAKYYLINYGSTLPAESLQVLQGIATQPTESGSRLIRNMETPDEDLGNCDTNGDQEDHKEINNYKTRNSSGPSHSSRDKYRVFDDDRVASACVDALEELAAQAEENEFQIFGRSVAAQLTKMPIEDALEMQINIQNMLGARRLEIFRRQKKT